MPLVEEKLKEMLGITNIHFADPEPFQNQTKAIKKIHVCRPGRENRFMPRWRLTKGQDCQKKYKHSEWLN